jgi:chaperonin GroEL (HSP60 family)
MLRQVAERTMAGAGDGSATAVLLANGLLAGGLDAVEQGVSPLAVKRGIERGAAAAARALRVLARPLSGRRERVHVATTAAHGDDLVGELVVEALELNGAGHGVRVEEGRASGVRLVELARDERGQPVLRVGNGGDPGAPCRAQDVRRALAAVEWAALEGVVPGGGLALLRAAPAVERTAAMAPAAERPGVRVVARALEAPLRAIAEQTGLTGDEAIARLAASTGDVGLDGRCGRYVDLMKAGIVDPARVVRVALESAATVTGLLLLTEATVTDDLEVVLGGAA